MELNGKKFLLVGFGREGQATLRFLLQHTHASRIFVCDSSPNITGLDGLTVYCGENYLEEASKSSYDWVVRSPGIARSKLEKYFPSSAIITATHIFLAVAPGKVIGVTGTKGKSTTASLIAHLLSSTFNDVRLVGNIGKPALDYLADANDKTIFLSELSSFQLDDIRTSPPFAVLLPIVPEHLDYHGSFEAYTSAKYKIFCYQDSQGILLTNEELQLLANQKYLGKIVEVNSQVRWEDGKLCLQHVKTNLHESELKLHGKGALENVCYAVVAALEHSVPVENILAALKSFEPLPHRLQTVAIKNGVTYINDSLCTVPEALVNALDAFAEKVSVVIAGGHDRGIEYEILGSALVGAKLKRLVLFHGTGEKIERAFKTNKGQTEIRYVDSMKEAVTLASEAAPSGSVVLLSPASSSFGLFKDYADRGQQFIKAVESIEQN